MKSIQAVYKFARWVFFAVLIVSCTEEPRQFYAQLQKGESTPKSFVLTDQYGQLRNVSEFQGKVVVMFFGYTQCPDVCPISLTELLETKRILGSDANGMQVVFITVDPARDTKEMLKLYMESFDPKFLALVPTPAELKALSKEFKVHYSKVEGPTPTSYTMDHSAGSYILDKKGVYRLHGKYRAPPKELATDIRKLINE